MDPRSYNPPGRVTESLYQRNKQRAAQAEATIEALEAEKEATDAEKEALQAENEHLEAELKKQTLIVQAQAERNKQSSQ